MKIAVKSLLPGHITEKEYYSADGELLIGRNVTLSEHHLEALLRRNIFDIYIKDETSELEQIIGKNFEDIESLSFATSKTPESMSIIPQLQPGEEGFSQLLNDKLFSEINEATGRGKFEDSPEGPCLKNSMKQLYLADRTQEYKKKVDLTYSQALKQIEWILRKLMNAEKVDGDRIRQVVELFMDTFVTDKNIMMAVSFRKSAKEEYIFAHTLNVCILAMSIAAAYGYSKEQVIHIGMGSILHDLGMLLLPPEIRFKKGRLSSGEWFEIRKHPLLGLYLTEKLVRTPDSVKFILYQAHERDNGNGYPKQRSTRFIHNYAKIMQIADIYEAISSPRPYRDALVPFKCIEFLIKMSEKGFISNDFLKAFLSCTSFFPVGSLLELNNAKVARVISVNQARLNRPVVSVLKDEAGKFLGPGEVYQLDLSREEDVKVVRSLPFDYPGMDLMDGF